MGPTISAFLGNLDKRPEDVLSFRFVDRWIFKQVTEGEEQFSLLPANQID